jgi:hypothetical protein
MIAEFRAGAVLSESLKILTRNFGTFFTIGLVCYFPLIIFGFYAVMAEEQGEPLNPNLVMAIQNLLGLIVGPLLTGALAFAVFQALRGKPVGINEAIGIGFRRILPLLGVAICSGLFIFAGLIMLVIPGIIFACMVYVASVVCVVEQQGVFASMTRSRELTAGNRSAIFSILFMIFLLSLAIGFVIGIALGASGSRYVIFGGITVLQLLVTIWSSAATVVAYYHLRSLKESIDVEDIAKVFE